MSMRTLQSGGKSDGVAHQSVATEKVARLFVDVEHVCPFNVV